MSEVTVLAYGAGNTASVRFALERLGATVRLTDDLEGIAAYGEQRRPSLEKVGRL